MSNNEWIEGNNFPEGKIVIVKIRHCNPELKLKDEVVEGSWGDDGFYFSDGGELSFNWDIIAWKPKD